MLILQSQGLGTHHSFHPRGLGIKVLKDLSYMDKRDLSSIRLKFI